MIRTSLAYLAAALCFHSASIAQSSPAAAATNNIFASKFLSLGLKQLQYQPLTHERCRRKDSDPTSICVIKVKVGPAGLPDNNCGVYVADVIILPRAAANLKIEWRLQEVKDNGKLIYRFLQAPNAIEIADNVANENDIGANDPPYSIKPGSGIPVFEDPGTPSDLKHVKTRKWNTAKAFNYAIQLEYWEAAEGRYIPCDPYDPIIVNRD